MTICFNGTSFSIPIRVYKLEIFEINKFSPAYFSMGWLELRKQ
jgi:hypothetical protein